MYVHPCAQACRTQSGAIDAHSNACAGMTLAGRLGERAACIEQAYKHASCCKGVHFCWHAPSYVPFFAGLLISLRIGRAHASLPVPPPSNSFLLALPKRISLLYLALGGMASDTPARIAAGASIPVRGTPVPNITGE